ncbi:MAG: hypothetical protein Q4E57_08035, partial [Eubacteriales bacterium]|nr:hypothetical protein [Eubacteriales bacterium]
AGQREEAVCGQNDKSVTVYYDAGEDIWRFKNVDNNYTYDPIGAVDADYCFDGLGGSLRVDSKDMCTMDDGTKYFYVAIPVNIDKESDINYAGLALGLDYDNFTKDVAVSALTMSYDETGKHDHIMNITANTAYYGADLNKAREAAIKEDEEKGNHPTTTWAIQNFEDGKDQAGKYYYQGYVLYYVSIAPNANVQNFSAYIDTAGAGYVTTPYDLYDGTSMAAPLVTGCAAVIAYNNSGDGGALAGLTGGDYTARLKELVLQSSTSYSSFKGMCQTGAQLDMDPKSSPRPVITEIYAGATSYDLIIDGANFGDAMGELVTDGLDFEVVSWTDTRIIIKVNSDPQYALYKFDVTNTAGDTASRYYAVDNGPQDIYELTFSLPADNFDPMRPDALDIKHTQLDPGYQNFRALNGHMYLVYGVQLWECFPDSKTLTYVPYNDYTFLNTGASSGGELFLLASKTRTGSDGKEENYNVILGLDSKGDYEKEINVSDDLIWERSGMFYWEDGLYLLGGMKVQDGVTTVSKDIVRLDLNTMNAEKVGEMPLYSSTVNVVSPENNDDLYATGIFFDKDQGIGEAQHLYKITVNADGSLSFEDISDIVPEGAEKDGKSCYYAIAAIPEGIAIAGLRSDDNADTWFYENGVLTKYDRSASMHYLFTQCAGYANGYLYVLGSTYYDDGPILMRASYILPEDPPAPPKPEPVKPVVTGGGSGSRERTSIGYGAGNVPNIYYEPAGRWIKDATGWWYSFNTGAYYAIDAAGNTVYYGADGQMSSYMINGVTYTGPNGNYIKSAWALIKGKWYHFDERGYMQEGFIKEVTDENGAVVVTGAGAGSDSGSGGAGIGSNAGSLSGKLTVKWYYLTPGSGEMAKGLIEPGDGYLYYMSPVDGAMQTGNITVDGIDRYFRSDMPAQPTYTLDPATGIYVRNSVDDIPYGAAIKR